MYESYDPEESLLCPKKVTNVMKLDILLSSELGKKIFYSSKNSLVTSSSKKIGKRPAKTPSLRCIRPSVSFVSQSRKTPVPINLTPTKEHRGNMKNDIDQEHQKIAQISNKMKDLESKLSTDMKKLEGPLTSNQRKNVFEEIKKTNSQYKSLKVNRLTTIKRHRIINNEYKEGIPGFEVYSWQENKKHYKKVNKSHLHSDNRRDTLTEKTLTSNALDFDEGKNSPCRPRGVKRLQESMPLHYRDSKMMFVSQSWTPNPTRAHKLSDASHGHRNYNIVTGAIL